MTFFGTQPMLTQVPPTVLFSITAVFLPYSAARSHADNPPLPAPIDKRS